MWAVYALALADPPTVTHDLSETLVGTAQIVFFLMGAMTIVEVVDAQVHGGPYPATSDARGTSVGTLAIERFLRPVCYQNCADELLPEALQNANPLGIERLVDGCKERVAINL
mgnify:CR=1 FL=1